MGRVPAFNSHARRFSFTHFPRYPALVDVLVALAQLSLTKLYSVYALPEEGRRTEKRGNVLIAELV